VTTSIAVCALTFRRASIRTLLEAIGRLEPPPDATVRVVVVDNDATGSAREVVTQAAATLPWPVAYAVEPTPGIATARNRAVATAGDVDLVAFIDDDEVPDPRWLAALVEVQRSAGADVVTGPIVPTYERTPPTWMVDGGFFERRRFSSGTELDWARTGNVLIARSVLGDAPFDPKFDLSGGEDTHFFMRIHLAGARIVWADDAVVTDLVPAERMNLRWLVQREYRRGNTLSVCLRDLTDSWPRRLRRVAQAGVRVAQGLALLGTAVVTGRAGAVRGLRRIAFGTGLVTGLTNRPFQEYRKSR
jgi:succinoglycan biosynthesis protein ExoM